jgi:hypothetical protein
VARCYNQGQIISSVSSIPLCNKIVQKQTDVIQNYENGYICFIGQGVARHT